MLTTHPPVATKDIGSSILGYVCKACISRILKDKFVTPSSENKNKDFTKNAKRDGDKGPPVNEENKDFTPESDYENDSPVANFTKLVNSKLAEAPTGAKGENGRPKCLICGATLKLAPTADGMSLKTHSGSVGAGPRGREDSIVEMKRDFALSMISCPMCDRKSLRAVQATTGSPPGLDHRHFVGGDFDDQGESGELKDLKHKLERCERSTYVGKDGSFTKSMIMAQEDRLFSPPIPIKLMNAPQQQQQQPLQYKQLTPIPKFSHNYPFVETKCPKSPLESGFLSRRVCPRCHLPLNSPYESRVTIPRPMQPAPLTIPTILATQVNKIRSIMKSISPNPLGSTTCNSQWARPQMMGDMAFGTSTNTLPIFYGPIPKSPRLPSINYGSVQKSICPYNQVVRGPRCCGTCKVPYTPVPSPQPPPAPTFSSINRNISFAPISPVRCVGSYSVSRCPGCGQPNASQPSTILPQSQYNYPGNSFPTQAQNFSSINGMYSSYSQPLRPCSNPTMQINDRCAFCGQFLISSDRNKTSFNSNATVGPISSGNVCTACQRQTGPYQWANQTANMPRFNMLPSMSITRPQMFWQTPQQSINMRPLYPVINTMPFNNAVGYTGSNAGLPMGRAMYLPEPITFAYFHIEELAKLLIHMIDLQNPKHTQKSLDEVLERCRIYFEGIVEFKETRDVNSRLDFNKGILKGDNNNAMMLQALRNRLKEKDKFLFRKMDHKSEFEKVVQNLLQWYSCNPSIPITEAMRHAKELYDAQSEKQKDMAIIANEVLKDLNIRADPIPETLRLLRTCLKSNSDLTSKDIVELTYLTYTNVVQSKEQGRAVRVTKSLHKTINGHINVPAEYENEIVKNVCMLQGKYPFVSSRTVMFYSLDMYKSFLEGPLPELSHQLNEHSNPTDPLLNSLNDLKMATKALKDNVDRIKDFMQVLDQKGDLAKISFKNFDKTPQSIMKNRNSSIDREYILEYFKNRDSKSSSKNLATINDDESTDGSTSKGKRKLKIRKIKSGT